tara:strand:- start:13183 stop:14679 length:1497 start_codon:yes stop_codon:yes gene_type:complete
LKENIFLSEEVKGLFSSGDVFSIAEDIEGKVFRQTANRITKEFVFEGNRYFIKLHYGVGWKEIIKNILKLRSPTLGAYPEWKALNKLKSLGIDCPEPVGYFSVGINPANMRSFLITKALIDTISLEDALKKKSFQKLDFTIKKRFIEKVALISRNLHNSGINHRDFYLCHFHVDKDMDAEKKIYLIDLHRAQLRSIVPLRWASKDIGGLIHSALGYGLNENDFYRFMITYLNCSLKEVLTVRSDFLNSCRNRAFKMFMKPILKEIDISLPQEQKLDTEYSRGSKDQVRWIVRIKEMPEHYEELVNGIDSFMKSGDIIKDEVGHKIVSVNFKDKAFIIKKYQTKGWLHNLRKLFSQTRALTAWKASHWYNAAGINTLNIVCVIEKFNVFGTTESYLISSVIQGERLDKHGIETQNIFLIPNRLVSFFKRLKWIGFNHGDAKSSNFFINQGRLIVLDLDIAKRSFFRYQNHNRLIKDQKRIQTSLKTYSNITSSLKRRLN